MHRAVSIVLAAATAATASAVGPVCFFSNYGGFADPENAGVATGATTLSGISSPPGFVWSEVANDSPTTANASAGFSGHRSGSTGAFRLADDFVVPAGYTFDIDNVLLWCYRSGSLPGDVTVDEVNLRIWNGRPEEEGSAVIFGDTSTDRLVEYANTNIYRVFNSVVDPDGGGPLEPPPPSTSRLVRQLTVAADITLGPGEYWLDWQFVSASPTAVFAPMLTAPGVRATPGANARQFVPGSTSPPAPPGWQDVIDTGSPASAPDVVQGAPFILKGEYTPEPASLALLACVGLFIRRR